MPQTPPEQKPPDKRKRGAPLGNKNAIKHGFYAHSFHKVEGGKLDTDLQGKFDDEIALMRILILRTADSIKNSSHMTTEAYLASLRGITLAIGRLESIYRTQKEVYKTETTLESALEELKYLEWNED